MLLSFESIIFHGDVSSFCKRVTYMEFRREKELRKNSDFETRETSNRCWKLAQASAWKGKEGKGRQIG